MMRKLGPDDYQRMPWKNGGGETLQIAIGPAGATVDDFDWRVSAARVATAGPFSAFVGIDRSLAVLSGRGMTLVTGSGDATRETLLDADSEAYSFAGELPARAELIAGEAVVDFNVMTRRSRFRHGLRRLNVPDQTQVAADVLVLYCIEGRIDCHDLEGGVPASLAASDALVAQPRPSSGAPGEPRAAVVLRLDARGAEPARLWVVQLFAVDRFDV